MVAEPALAREVFAEDHPCQALRGYPVPSRARVRRAVAERCVWLERRIEDRVAAGLPCNAFVRELAALVALVDDWDRLRHASSTGR